MIISVRVKTNSKEECIEVVDDLYVVRTKETAKENKANIAVVSLLSDYFNVSKKNIVIKRGLKSKNKIVEVAE